MTLFEKSMYPKFLLVIYLCIFAWSGINPKDIHVWLLEITGVLFLIAVYLLFHKRIRFSDVTTTWFFIGATLITIGAHYSFPHVPVFESLKSAFGIERNNFDKLGHVVQGILPVLISWEVLVKNKVILNYYWINFLSLCIALSVSAFYELFEWLFIVVLGNNSYTYDVLGTQGYVWDAQSDMLCALIGAVLTILFGKKHLMNTIRKLHSFRQDSPTEVTNENSNTVVNLQ